MILFDFIFAINNHCVSETLIILTLISKFNLEHRSFQFGYGMINAACTQIAPILASIDLVPSLASNLSVSCGGH